MALRGFDCASYQAGIDPSVVPCDFVIVKSTQGTTYTNPDFQRLAEATLAAGKALGIYHYASGGNATDEANHMLDVAGGYIGRAIFCLDWEGVQNSAFGSGRDSAWIDEFCSVIENRVGSECLVYLSKSVMEYAAGHKLWVAQYANMNRTGYQDSPWNEGAYDCTIRQYTSMGRLDGWGGDLDLDKAYMSREEWDAWAAGNGVPAPAGKSNEQIADEVIEGQWGNGDDRRNRLSSAGYDYVAIQSIVNAKLQPWRKSNEQIAYEVINGAWGNGDDRRNRLAKAGYDPDAIQSIVNAKLGASAKKTYKVKSGDTLSEIAAAHGTTWKRLADINGIANPNLIYPGQVLTIG